MKCSEGWGGREGEDGEQGKGGDGEKRKRREGGIEWEEGRREGKGKGGPTEDFAQNPATANAGSESKNTRKL
jgi:hypothetical protein